jgi:putative ABC transport system permease protein
MKRSFRSSDIKPDPRRDVADELRFHLEMRTQEFIEKGMSPEGARVTAAGVVVGLAVAFGATRLMRSLLYDVSATDTGIYVVVALLTAMVAVLASYVPARRATRVSPTTALREG